MVHSARDVAAQIANKNPACLLGRNKHHYNPSIERYLILVHQHDLWRDTCGHHPVLSAAQHAVGHRIKQVRLPAATVEALSAHQQPSVLRRRVLLRGMKQDIVARLWTFNMKLLYMCLGS